MKNLDKFYIGGTWVAPSSGRTMELINPATERCVGQVPLGTETDVDNAVCAARTAFNRYSGASRLERIELLRKLLALYNAEYDELARLMTLEMGTVLEFSRTAQAHMGRIHIETGIKTLERFEFDIPRGSTLLTKEPIGVVGLITPWNWPMHQLMLKVVPALAAGCTLVIKPSEYSPLSAVLVADLIDRAGFPAGAYNYVQGLGHEVGAALSRHPDVEMISFTGSTRAGIAVAQDAALTVKRVSQELGGKSANIILPDADFEAMVVDGVNRCFINAGQACASPTRMLVPHDRMGDAAEIAAARANTVKVGSPTEDGVELGPVVNERQFNSIQALIESGVAEGANLAAGGPGRPKGLSNGYYVRPTVFSHVSNDMHIAREEIFGPVLSIIGYRNDDDAVRIANDSPYGLAAYIQSGDAGRAQALARRLRVGSVFINEASYDPTAPFGGYKQSGNGREGGEFGLEEYLELKTIGGFGP